MQESTLENRSSPPAIPGPKAPHYEQTHLRRAVSALSGIEGNRYVGTQPVTFNEETLEQLVKEDFWTFEKADGQRVLLYFHQHPRTSSQQTYLINRKNDFFELAMPGGRTSTSPPMTKTLLDGEIVWEDSGDGAIEPCLLLFDAISIRGRNLTKLPIQERHKSLQTLFTDSAETITKRAEPKFAAWLPFRVRLQNLYESYELSSVLQSTIPSLRHRNDGLIFVRGNTPYKSGTNTNLQFSFKWKPLKDLSVDFKLHLSNDANQSPPQRFVRLQHCTGGTAGNVCHEDFETILLDKEEWAAKESRLQSLDGAVIECAPAAGTSNGTAPFSSQTLTIGSWELRRVRHDKSNANYFTVVQEIMQSINFAIAAERLVDAAPQIRLAWKARHPELGVSFDSHEGRSGEPAIECAKPDKLGGTS